MFLVRVVLLFVTWCAFSGLFDPFHLTLGVISSVWVAAASSEIALTQKPQSAARVVSQIFALVGYFVWLIGQVFAANIDVLRISLSSTALNHLSPKVILFRTRLSNEFARFLLAHSITLTPGTVTVRIDGDQFTVHALTEEMAAATPGDMESRLVKIFGCVKEGPDG